MAWPASANGVTAGIDTVTGGGFPISGTGYEIPKLARFLGRFAGDPVENTA